ncbi:hypothetical protein ACDQ55_10265 [Chitinophaga sp. 30R24]|uniref:hypothetical protein n=1 Tax=Chitinophaga sp. 30R24 TaxID=3248838 RepID=UPI003B908AFC
MLKVYFSITCCFLCGLLLQAQTRSIGQFNQHLTPSPMVAALGTYGGVDVQKNTGGISKSISLLEIRQRDLIYSPSINYNSTGIKVDDWGSRVGIGWKENLMPIITRVVKGIPDERALSRTADETNVFGERNGGDYSAATLAKAQALATHNTSIDGQYDIFSYNLLGSSGQFIIRENKAVILNQKNNVKIDILSVSPTYTFTITTPDGVKYDFSKEIETTKFSSENSCDVDNPNMYSQVATAWFVCSMISPAGSTISFAYQSASFSYIYDFTEFYIFTSYNNKTLPCSRQDEEGDMYNGYNNNRATCVRHKVTSTKLLSMVTGDNFTMVFDYLGRNDIVNEGLLNGITLSNGSKIIKHIGLEYEKASATAPFEPVLQQNLDQSDLVTEQTSLNTRYFLKALHVKNAEEDLAYKFNYNSPTVLPHRFSFSKDYLGCYNGKSNVSTVPQVAIDGLDGLGINYPYADRSTSIVGGAGLLNRIEYPTGGSDTILYEQNRFKTIVSHDDIRSISDWYSTDEDVNYNGNFFTMGVDVESKVTLVFECFLDNGAASPTDPDGAEAYAQVQLIGPNGPMDFPRMGDQIDLRLGATRSTTFYVNGVPAPDGYLTFYPNEEYNLLINLQGKHTALRATMYYSNGMVQELVDSIFVGYRVKKVITRSNNNDLVRLYDYNHFKVDKGQLTIYPDSSSLVVATPGKYRATGMDICYDYINLPTSPAGPIHIISNIYAYETYRLLPNSNTDINVYKGLPYAYSQITEFLDSASTSFTASNYEVNANGFAAWWCERYPTATAVNPEMEDFAWNNGLERERYIGTKSAGIYNVLKEHRWRHSVVQSPYHNYSVCLIAMPAKDRGDQIGNYMINYYENYSSWEKLDTAINIDYSQAGNLITTTFYKYNSDDKNMEEESTYDSKGYVLTSRYFHPRKMVSEGLDFTGVYQNMVNANYISPSIEIFNIRSGTQFSRERVQYASFNQGMFLPESISTQAGINTPLVLRASNNQYDTKGNILEQQLANEVKTVYLWGYKGQYPVARIVGSDYSTVLAHVDTALLNNGTAAQIVAQLTSMRSYFSTNPLVQISTYTYQPLVGMITETDPNGKAFFYEYDESNRLKCIRDEYNYILKRFCYNYAGQPEGCPAN